MGDERRSPQCRDNDECMTLIGHCASKLRHNVTPPGPHKVFGPEDYRSKSQIGETGLPRTGDHDVFLARDVRVPLDSV